ncbi:MAG TPA: 1,4-dihydroxy-6-naphthoate synthase [Nitrospirota bacterium]|jgi:1,4-dihydroxy-6-naphthoate synthase
MKLTLGYSPCPNDTFIFYGLTHGRTPVSGVDIVESLDDVETLNRRALKTELDLTKVSFHALAYLREDYCLLKSGAALGRGCGPLVVSKNYKSMEELRGKKIAIPGRYTTAQLLLLLYDKDFDNIEVMPFEKIMPAVAEGRVDAGLIIHEGRFTYQGFGLNKLIDLGQWWESESGLPIPLGGILARRSLGADTIRAVEDGIRKSIGYSYANRTEAMDYIKRHAQEMEEGVINSHIELYVNSFSLDLGDEGVRAVEALFDKAVARGVISPSDKSLFL